MFHRAQCHPPTPLQKDHQAARRSKKNDHLPLCPSTSTLSNLLRPAILNLMFTVIKRLRNQRFALRGQANAQITTDRAFTLDLLRLRNIVKRIEFRNCLQGTGN